jgi:hypothetical protein
MGTFRAGWTNIGNFPLFQAITGSCLEWLTSEVTYPLGKNQQSHHTLRWLCWFRKRMGYFTVTLMLL